MKTVSEDRDTMTIQFTREEATNIRAAVNYVSALVEYLDREALDGWRMTTEDADEIAEQFSNLTTKQLAHAKSA